TEWQARHFDLNDCSPAATSCAGAPPAEAARIAAAITILRIAQSPFRSRSRPRRHRGAAGALAPPFEWPPPRRVSTHNSAKWSRWDVSPARALSLYNRRIREKTDDREDAGAGRGGPNPPCRDRPR